MGGVNHFGTKKLKWLPDIILVAGYLTFCFGCWLAWNPAGFIVAGALAIVTGLKIART